MPVNLSSRGGGSEDAEIIISLTLVSIQELEDVLVINKSIGSVPRSGSKDSMERSAC